ncbi:uncharacterized protein ACRADG_010328 [Cochliomyia hominivorax]
MNSLDSSDQQQNGTSTAESYSPFMPITPNTSEITTYKAPIANTKPTPTKTMLQEAIKAIAARSRKAFSLASIKQYIMENYLPTSNEVKRRLPYMRRFFKNALESGDIIHVKGHGLTGSFRVPQTSPMHKKNVIKKEKNLKRKAVKKAMKSTKVAAKKVMKSTKVKMGPVLKANKVKKIKRNFSAKI